MKNLPANQFFLVTCARSTLRLALTRPDNKTVLKMSTIVTNIVSKEAFEATVHSAYLMQLGPDQAVPLQLVEYKLQLLNALQECFSLLFQAPVDAPNEQLLRTLQHQSLGELEIFLVPIKKNADGLFYEAVFNRMLK